MKRTVYLDNAATTKTDPEVIKAMMPYYIKMYGNPSASYEFGNLSSTAIDEARLKIARFINADWEEIRFTSCGTESDNWVFRGLTSPGDHIITSAIEHHAILNTCKYLEEHGVEVTYIGVDKNGVVNPNDIKNAIKPNTKLISIMYANNEIGTIQPIKEIGQIAHDNGILFHTDAVQVYGHVQIDVQDENIDLLSSSAHKLNGPKGIGFLYIRKGIEIKPLLYGGGQQDGLRPGTENVPAIVGYGAATDIAKSELWERRRECLRVNNYFTEKLLKYIPDININGIEANRLPNNISVSFLGIRGETLLILLEMHGIYVSTGSACNSASGETSHVLTAIGLPEDVANSTIRFTLSHETTIEDIDYVIDVLIQVVGQLRMVNKRNG